MKVISFLLKGKMAHFRRYYSNSSSLSYTLPPRTTITGIIAGILGYKRDSYYELFSLEKCNIAIGIRQPVKKNVQTLNLLMIKGPNDFRGDKPNPSQTPTEIITPSNIRTGELEYQIWFHHEDEELMNELKDLLNQDVGFCTRGISVALGTAQHLGWIEYLGESEVTEEINGSAKIFSAVPVGNVIELDIKENIGKENYFIIKEELPLEFDRERKLKQKADFLVNLNSQEVEAKIKKAFKLNSGEVITWLEVS
ncbi:type I-B CRISPR-associated protein Cas5b [Natranaerofaba carboxydovora]|uniref:type I-B CRISPR-associated protein Cas5b n=1 Tax=Natranaerofaba carboxydovora TaxID=2742683 RepID=UPI001F140C5B|nr:type I-B CRISPR-associated protein Cas5b [Natranaerofaba carboxydovora]UMZ72707.1 CRISPR-associated protein (Cas_Cas5) [Natranaerofaba carboxydovora]